MISTAAVALLSLIPGAYAHADTLLQYTFPSVSSGVPTTVASGVSGSTISNSQSLPIWELPANYAYPTDPELRLAPKAGGTSAATAVSTGSYFTFAITPDASKTMTLSTVTFAAARGGATTPRGWVLRSSIDSFASDIDAQPISTTRPAWSSFTVSLPAGSFSNLSSAVTFRLYAYAPTTASSIEMDSLTINGTVSGGLPPANAAVTGWAWSSNIGWIQFDTGVPSPVTVDTSSGNFSGYAWSSNIGWVSFNSNSCGAQANVNLTTGAVTGWAKALSADGNGWDGCIELSGTNHSSPDASGSGGVTYKPGNGAFVGFAWGGPVVGWVQFNPTIPAGGTPDVTCATCSIGGPAPVITGNCAATPPYTNVPPGTSVTFTANPTSGVPAYSYNWGVGSTSVNTTAVTYSTTGPGPTVRIGDSATPVKGYSAAISCPTVTVLAPLGASNLHIGRGSVPSAATLSTLPVTQGVMTPFILAWNITLTNDYTCSASIVNDPNIANWNSNWKSITLDSGNGTDNGDGTMTWNSNTGGSLNAPASGLATGNYQFKLTCAGGAAGPQSTSATLRVTSSSENEI